MNNITLACLLPALTLLVAAGPAESPTPIKDNSELRRKEALRIQGGPPTLQDLRYRQALAEQEALRWNRKMPGAPAQSGIPAWQSLGPTSLDSGVYAQFPDELNAGRPVAIVTHPTNPKLIYVAIGPGGVWRCKNADPDGGEWIWESITDGLYASGSQGNLSVGSLVMDPADPNTLYMGMGDSHGPHNVGFFVSRDGGDTWEKGGTLGTSTRTHAMISPATGVVIAATNAGLFRSIDGGRTFAPVTPAGATFFTSVQALGPLDLVAAGSAGGSISTTPLQLWYSSNGGATWQLGTQDASLTAQSLSGQFVTLATSPASGTLAYGLVPTRSAKLAPGLLKTTDKGRTWSFVASPTGSTGLWSADSDGGQSTYNQMITVDPVDPNRLVAGAVTGSYRSLDGGQTWSQLTHWAADKRVYSHADMQTATWSQTGPRVLYVGNDGGISLFRDPYRPTIPAGAGDVPTDLTFVDNRRNKGLASHLVYTVGSTAAATPADARHRVILGMQDNSTGLRVNAGSGLAASTTYTLTPPTGDGMGVHIHALDGNKMLAASYQNTPYYTQDGGSRWYQASTKITDAESDRHFYTQIVPGLGDATGNTVYTLTYKAAYKSTDYGRNYTRLSTTGIDPAHLAERLAVSKSDPQSLAFTAWHMNTGALVVYLSRNGGQSWTQTGALPANFGAPGAIWSIWFNTFDANTLYATSATSSTSRSHAVRSTDGGATWSNLDASGSSNGLPFGIPIWFVRNDPRDRNTLYAGTDMGLYASTDHGQSWSRHGQGLPMVGVRDMYQAPDASFLRVATFGRGVWELQGAASAPTILQQPASLTVAPGQPASFQVSAGGTAPFTYQWRKDGTPLGGATQSLYSIPSVAPSHAGTYDVVVSNTQGSITSQPATLTLGSIQVTVSPAQVGLHTSRSATFTAAVTGTPSTAVTWQSSGGNLSASGNQATFSSSVAGTYTLTAAAVADPTRTATTQVKVHGADFSTPGKVAPMDLLVLCAAWGQQDSSLDVTGDGLVNDDDFNFLMSLLGW